MTDSAFTAPDSAAMIQRPLYMALADKTIANTTVETSTFSSSCVGSKTIPAGRLVPSTTIQIKGGGKYSIPLVSPGNATVNVKLGGVIVAQTIVQGGNLVTGLVAGITDAAFEFECNLVVRAIGTSGAVAPLGSVNFATTAVAGGRSFSDLIKDSLGAVADATVNTTIDNDIDVTFTWATASTSRTITVRGTVVTLLN